MLAGSDPTLPDVLAQAASMKDETIHSRHNHPKLVDLFSRINGGVIKIPSLREVDFTLTKERDRRIDKVCVAIALFKEFPSRRSDDGSGWSLEFYLSDDFQVWC